ncbi:hypothetical protein GCM10007415_31470 [Parapedobacter pyrenivorans]|uniref:Uncharacterized protein n=1 Tax=Parapedobacter pyrenivorans TaxID=1305674 RepID=A0A917HW81_9SPHI|nr:hypothetical protein GCM10007415_31470 [Parapedobacter pyrenivorans]
MSGLLKKYSIPKVDSKILLGKILQRFVDRKIAKVRGYNKFGYVKQTDKQVYVSRENGENTPVFFKKILTVLVTRTKDGIIGVKHGLYSDKLQRKVSKSRTDKNQPYSKKTTSN